MDEDPSTPPNPHTKTRHDVLIVYDEAMLAHQPTGWDPSRPEWTAAVKELLLQQYPDKDFDADYAHPERPQRLSAVVDKLRAEPVPHTRWRPARPADRSALARVHTGEHIDFIDSLAGRSAWLDIDTTAVSPDSVVAATLAAGAGITALEAIARREVQRAFCAVRPPGHHALADRAMGFCLYNNVAITAAHARQLGMDRVLIWDWDLHHGNGTQEIFSADPSVLFIDTHHAAPYYPGTGAIEEIGVGRGEGTTFNVPLPAGSGNAALLEVADRIIRPAAEAFRPDVILISAGFDGHHLDQAFAMDETGFAVLTTRMCQIADTFAQGRLIVLLEGGYNADGLAVCAHACVNALTGVEAAAMNVLEDDPGLDEAARAASFHAARLGSLQARAIGGAARGNAP